LFHGFVLSKGVFTTVDFPDAHETQVLSINAKGEIVGAYFDANGDQHGFLGTPAR
jgi:probable HAF family extracellular repeat protein